LNASYASILLETNKKGYFSAHYRGSALTISAMNAATINKIATTVDPLVRPLSTNIDILMTNKMTAAQNISLYYPFLEDISDACGTARHRPGLDPLQETLVELASSTIPTGG
jgi:hypothetical protein